MSPVQTAAAHAAPHVEAFRSTGTSPGSRPLDATLHLDRHGRVRVPLGFEVQGPAHAPPVVVLGGISANAHLGPTAADPAPGWWPGVAGPGLALDPRRHRLIGLDWLGGPEALWTPSAPITPADQARAVVAVLDHLGIARATVVGASYGGMVALSLASAHPERVERAVVLCAAHRAHPMATAVRSVQRGIVRLAEGTPREADAVALARSLAMTTYRSAREFDARFAWEAEDRRAAWPVFPVEGYLRSRGEAFARRFSAAAFLRLSESIDLHRVDPGAVVVPTTLLSVDSDTLAPPWLVDELERGAPGVVEHVRLSSVFGHDAFLKEADSVAAVLEAALGREVDA